MTALKCSSLCLILSVLFLPFASADMVDTSDYAPWETCALCHGYSGDSAMSKFPKLNGQKSNYLEKQIRDFQQGNRSNDGGQMSEMVAELNDQDIQSIVSWFASQNHPLPYKVSLDANEKSAMEEIMYKGRGSLPACVQCHHQKSSVAPRIRSQHASYIEKQLNDFRDNERENDGTVMHEVASLLTPEEISLISQYLSSVERIENP